MKAKVEENNGKKISAQPSIIVIFKRILVKDEQFK